ncbi:hypothetical protein MSIMFI_01166 [Mycobacterium simulans]|nr:hypothetical protein MSIMFI_01166 [Mycobacterium simulans]
MWPSTAFGQADLEPDPTASVPDATAISKVEYAMAYRWQIVVATRSLFEI